MIFTLHVLVGALIGKTFSSLVLVIIIAILSHYILDFIPHRSPRAVKGFKERGLRGANKRDLILKTVEPIIGIIVIVYLIFGLNKEFAGLMLIGSFFAFFPDFLSYYAWKYDMKRFKRFLPVHGGMLYNNSKSLIVGILTQVIVGIIVLVLFFL